MPNNNVIHLDFFGSDHPCDTELHVVGTKAFKDPLEPQRKALEAHMEAPSKPPLDRREKPASLSFSKRWIGAINAGRSPLPVEEPDFEYVADAWTWLPIIKVLGFIVLSAFLGGLVVRWMNAGVL